MTMPEVLQLLAAVLGALASVATAVEARLVKRFVRADATSSESAIDLNRLSRMGRWRLACLKRAGVVVATEQDRYFLRPEKHQAYRRKRRVTALSVVLPFLVAVLVVIILVNR